ncbi:MAG: 2-iminoacetate synthase ThiH [Desulfohalobiaceae bacterium]|nr:2-iminoacetate synthase ThiH [Desulfohalobiaceae bacterium]
MSFQDHIHDLSWDCLQESIQDKTQLDAERALASSRKSFDDLLALLSPAASVLIEDMAQAAHGLTRQRFGRIIQMYAPIYISSECANACVYCGFNRHNTIRRATLSLEEVDREADALLEAGFRHVLLLTGESPRHVGVEYLGRIAGRLREKFSSIGIEVYPMDIDSYRSLIDSGVDSLTVYQETYKRSCYEAIHPAGPKRDYDWRLDTPDRGGRAGFRRLNIGALLGLAEWRVEGAFLAMHAAYLMKNHWRSHVSVSFPRLRPAAGGYEPAFPVADAGMVQLMCALRLFLPDAGLVISTREPRELRDNLVPLGITHMSAGSKTAPGGYVSHQDFEGQFDVDDRRSPFEVAEMIKAKGYVPVWKDWDSAFLQR